MALNTPCAVLSAGSELGAPLGSLFEEDRPVVAKLALAAEMQGRSRSRLVGAFLYLFGAGGMGILGIGIDPRTCTVRRTREANPGLGSTSGSPSRYVSCPSDGVSVA